MKACILYESSPIAEGPLRFEEAETPVPDADEIRIKVTACGICRTDLHIVEGELPQLRSPLIPGHQVVGLVDSVGSSVESFHIGQRVGAAWLRWTCGACRYCRNGRENLCERAEFNGWTKNGGFAQYLTVPAGFAYPLPEGLSDAETAPLLCAGIIGYRALKLAGVSNWSGARLGIYGFGAAGHVAIQIARSKGAEVFVATRDRARHQTLAAELGAAWVGDTFEVPPERLDAALIFAPAGEIVPAALSAVEKGGTVVLGGIHMSSIPQFDYKLIYDERVVRSVANNTREDGQAFLNEALSIPVRTSIQTFPLEEANAALSALKNDAIKGAGVLVMDHASAD